VWDSLETIQLQGLRVTVGGGLRYNSVAGPIRFDIGVRLGDDPFGTNDAKVGVEPRVGFHFGLGEAF
jgi:outer membrane translocation and assembly module TamA